MCQSQSRILRKCGDTGTKQNPANTTFSVVGFFFFHFISWFISMTCIMRIQLRRAMSSLQIFQEQWIWGKTSVLFCLEGMGCPQLSSLHILH